MAQNQASATRSINNLSPLKLTLAALVIFLASLIYWWLAVYTNPQRVFNAMLDNSLRLNGITKEVIQDQGGQGLRQTTQLSLMAEPAAVSKTTLSQADSTTVVVTESIGTPTSDYVRYVSIDTDQKSSDGGSLDFSSILNVWGSNEADPEDPKTDGELYNESVLGVIPFGRLDAAARKQLTDFMISENVYEVDFQNVEKINEDGRPRYRYQVTIDAEDYIAMLKKFGELTGLNHMDELDPASYAGQERLPFTLTVDVWSRQLTKVEYSDGVRTEVMSGHNAVTTVKPPQSPISVNELQQRLQEIR